MDSGLSAYLVAPIIAWAVAQLTKLIIALVKSPKRGNDYSLLFKSGDMPSSHSATVVALLVVVGVVDGIQSAIFGVTAIFSAVVIYDAVNVRRAVGEHGTILQKLLHLAKQEDAVFTAKGHRISEVAVGILVGIAAALIVLQIL